MTRSPLFYPLNRGMDADAGGAADLQTDVMRFMAILSLCLVAIFALVQSIPLAPVTSETKPEPAPQAPPTEQAVEPVEAPTTAGPPEPKAVTLTRPAPVRRPPEPAPVTLQRPAPKSLAASAQPTRTAESPAPTPVSTPAEPREGFTLQFESDVALTRLVARNVVNLYAIAPQKTERMSINRGEISFWPAAVPQQFHEMDMSTVPATVVDAWRRRGSAPAGTIKWGVTIPADMSVDLNRYLAERSGGALIISADGALRLEP